MNTMHCIHCGALLPENAKFCTSCGEPVQAAPAEPIEEPVVAEESVPFEPVQEPAQEPSQAYVPPVNASEGYKAASEQLPPSYSAPNYSSQAKPTYTAAAPAATNGLAIAGFVCSLIFLPVAVGALTAIAGLVLSILGLNSAKKLPQNKGRWLALAGTIISAIRIVLMLIGIIALFALLLKGAGHLGQELISNWPEINPYNF